MNILVLEASTSSAKALVYAGGREQNLCTRAYPPQVNDGVTHDMEGVYSLLLATGEEAARGHSIDMVALSGVWNSSLLLHSDLTPKTRLHTWAWGDPSAVAAHIRKDGALTRELYSRTGCMPNAIYPAMKLRCLTARGEFTSRDKVSFQTDYLYHRLTGEWACTNVAASGSGLLNIHTLDWDELALSLAGAGADQMPPLVPWNTTFPLAEEAAKALGLLQGIPVLAACADGALNQVGAGALGEGIMTISVGTSAALRMSAAKPVLPKEPSTWCYYAPGTWLAGAAVNGGTNCVDWFRQQLMGGKFSFGELEALLPGEDYPLFLPFLYGERCPGWQDDRAGAFVGLKGHHGPGHLYKGVLMGVAMGICHCYRLLTQLEGEPGSIRVSGGILKSRVWSQMLADLLGRPLECPEMEQASMMGAAVLARAAAGELSPRDYQPEPGRVYRPDAEKHRVYEERFEEYLDDYTKLKQGE